MSKKYKFSFQEYRNREKLKPFFLVRLIVYALVAAGLVIALFEFVKMAGKY